MNVMLYSNNCPKCKILEKKLKEKEVEYVKTEDFEEIISLGFVSAPVLKVDDEYMDFVCAVQWMKEV